MSSRYTAPVPPPTIRQVLSEYFETRAATLERCFGHQVLLRRQGHFYNRGRRPTCAGERHRVGLY